MNVTKDDLLEHDIGKLLQRLAFDTSQKNMYKIGVKVKLNNEEFYVVGLRTVDSSVNYGQPVKQLIIHKEKGVPTRLGFPVYLDQVMYVGDM